MLIEAAEFLPKWLNPDTSENRVSINSLMRYSQYVIHFTKFLSFLLG